MIKVKKILPNFWAPALINDDETGLYDDEKKEFHEWQKRHSVLANNCVSVEDDIIITRFNGLTTECLEYVFLIDDPDRYGDYEEKFDDLYRQEERDPVLNCVRKYYK